MTTQPSAVVPGRGARWALFVISGSVLLSGSTWLSASAVSGALLEAWSLGKAQAAWLSSSVQAGFITGTLLYAALNLSDRFAARRVFLVSAVLGAACNAAFAVVCDGLASAVLFRFLTGVTLAGVYPVGMKIVASWFRDGLGWRLGVLVGALVLGTSLPYLLRAIGADWPWRRVVLGASLLSVVGGVWQFVAVGDGPALRGRARFDLGVMFRVFRHRGFRLNAIGYFGHMWELYTFWSLLGLFLGGGVWKGPWPIDRQVLVFLVVAVGALGCAIGGRVSRRVGERRVALGSLVISAAACLGSPWLGALPAAVGIAYLLLWGVFVVSDSPQFSALAARQCPPEYTGTALTVQNGVGFAISAVSIQVVPWLAEVGGWVFAFAWLAPGPIIGAWAMWRLGARPEYTTPGPAAA